MSDLRTQLREYLDATAPPVEVTDIITDEVWVPSRRVLAPRRHLPGWVVALATALVILALIGVSALLIAREVPDVIDEPTPTTIAPPTIEREEPDVIDEPTPTTIAPPTIELAGSGPALLWEAAQLPLQGRLGWVVADEDRFYLSMTDSFDVTDEWSWFISDDARTWTPTPSYEDLLGSGFSGFDLEADLAWEAKIIGVDFPVVTTVDTDDGEVSSQELKLNQTTALDDPCFQPGVYGIPEEIRCDDYRDQDPSIAAGPQGVLILTEAVNADEGMPACSPDCDPTRQWIAYPIGWHSVDGSEWSPLPQTGPLVPGAGSRVSVAAVEDGFVVLRADVCEAWFTPDGKSWASLGRVERGSSPCPNRLTAWGGYAIGTIDSLWFTPSTSAQPFWLISRSGISRMPAETMPLVDDGVGSIAAGGLGVVAMYSLDIPELRTVEWLVEYSRDGERWSRRSLPSDQGLEFLLGDEILVGDEEVLVYQDDGSLLVGTPEES